MAAQSSWELEKTFRPQHVSVEMAPSPPLKLSHITSLVPRNVGGTSLSPPLFSHGALRGISNRSFGPGSRSASSDEHRHTLLLSSCQQYPRQPQAELVRYSGEHLCCSLWWTGRHR